MLDKRCNTMVELVTSSQLPDAAWLAASGATTTALPYSEEKLDEPMHRRSAVSPTASAL